MSLPLPTGTFIVLRIGGEIDLSTADIMAAALADALQRRPDHLLVDLAELVFCGVRGLALLVEAGNTASGQGTTYAVSAPSDLLNRVWTSGWPEGKQPTRYPTTAAGILAMAHQPDRRDRDCPTRPPTAGSRCCTSRSVPSRPAAPRLTVGD